MTQELNHQASVQICVSTPLGGGGWVPLSRQKKEKPRELCESIHKLMRNRTSPQEDQTNSQPKWKQENSQRDTPNIRRDHSHNWTKEKTRSWWPLLSNLRDRFSFFIDRSALLFIKAGVTPNLSTILGFLFAASAGSIFALRTSDILTYVAAPILVLVSGFFDALDGSLARLSGRVTKFGGVLDSTLDRLGEIFILSGIILAGLSSLFWGLTAIIFSLMVSYVRARAEVEGVKMAGVGFAERPERMLVLVAASLLRKIEYGVILISILSIITVAQRILYAHKNLD